MSKVVFKFFAIISVSTIFFSCLKRKEFPNTPAITFDTWEEVDVDLDQISVKFTDGDGDIGLEDFQTAPPYDTSSIYYYNFFMKYEALVDGIWIDTLNPDPPFYYRVPNITPTGQTKALRGTITVDLLRSFYDPFSDSIRFRIKLVDRALNESNEVLSSTIKNPNSN